MADITTDQLLDNMVDYIAEFITDLHKKDPAAVKVIEDNRDALSDKLEALTEELADSEELGQQDMMEFAALNLLLAASLGVPEVEGETSDEKDNPSNEESQG